MNKLNPYSTLFDTYSQIFDKEQIWDLLKIKHLQLDDLNKLKDQARLFKFCLNHCKINSKNVSRMMTCNNLKILDLSHNNVSRMMNWKNLKILDLSHNNIESLPNELVNLIHIKKLYLHNNNIAALPHNFTKLLTLKILRLDNNKLTFLPENFGDLCNIEFIGLAGNLLKELPLSFNKLKKLISNVFAELCLDNNPLDHIPECLFDFGLKKIEMINCNLECLDSRIKKMSRLEFINMYGNKLTCVPNVLFGLNLKWLDLSHCNISFIDPGICELKSLENLDLSCNKITSLPDTITLLTNLKFLTLSHNKLTCIPEHIGRLHNVEQLNLCYNNLNTLPMSVFKLKKMVLFVFKGNPLFNVPIIILHWPYSMSFFSYAYDERNKNYSIRIFDHGLPEWKWIKMCQNIKGSEHYNSIKMMELNQVLNLEL